MRVLLVVLFMTLLACSSAYRTTVVDAEECKRIQVQVERETKDVQGPGG